MLLSLEAFSKYADLVGSGSLEAVAVDFETTGLRVRDGDRAFIMGFAFDDVRHSVRTDSDDIIPLMQLFFSNTRTKYLAHNAKFEMSFLKHQFNTEIKGDIWDTEVMERIAHNGMTSYSLENCAIRHKQYKYVPMMRWLEKTKKLHHEAPEDLIVPYVEQDAWLSLYLYRKQRDTFTVWDKSPVPVSKLVNLESRTTKNLFKMEDTGLFLDTSYCYRALDHEVKRENLAKEKFKQLSGAEFINSRQCLSPIFRKYGLPVLRTELKNESFSDDTLELSKDHELIKIIRTIRNAQKRHGTYWSNLVDLAINEMIHPNIRQAGTVTGRFSCKDPNVQNWPDDTETGSEYPIRRAFIAPSGCQILSLDYKQKEYRFLIDQAQDLKAINDVYTGSDPHQKAADLVGVTRSKAKNAVFAKMYGASTQKLSEMLGISFHQASVLSGAIDRNAPDAAKYCRKLIESAEDDGWGYNIKGRRYFFPPSKPYCYPDYRIQGSCSEILRTAIDSITELIAASAKGRTALLIPIHDELVFQLDDCDKHLIPEFKKLMINAYKPWQLPMDVSATIGGNFHDLEDLH